MNLGDDVSGTYTVVFAFVLGLSFLLVVVFRSVVVPVTSIILNLLSVGAAYGLVVLVNQKAIGGGLFGFQQAVVIEAWLPLFLVSILFGLSMDYQVFLLSRIRERYTAVGDNKQAVAFGLRSTGQIIVGAAIIMVAVFGGFAAGKLVTLQEMGFGLAAAVLLDATVVRSVLVPSVMGCSATGTGTAPVAALAARGAVRAPPAWWDGAFGRWSAPGQRAGGRRCLPVWGLSVRERDPQQRVTASIDPTFAILTGGGVGLGRPDRDGR